MFVIVLLFFVGVLMIGLVTFGGGQSFFALFQYYFVNILNRVAGYEIISDAQFIAIFGLTNATPGPFATKITAFLGTIIAPSNLGLTIFIVIFAYILMTVPAALIMLWANKRVNLKSKKQLFKNFYKVMKPVTIAILIWVMIILVNNIIIDTDFKLIKQTTIKTVQTVLYVVVSFIVSFVCLYRFKINIFLLIAFFGIFGFMYFYFIVQG